MDSKWTVPVYLRCLCKREKERERDSGESALTYTRRIETPCTRFDSSKNTVPIVQVLTASSLLAATDAVPHSP